MREDIQCLRGIAILFVLLFHLAPNFFINGLLGVDMFFVISGFLMAKHLNKPQMAKDYLLFYYKRFRRILPLYLLVIFIITVMVHKFLGNFLWKNNDRYSLASLFMITNQLVIHDRADYINQFATATSSINGFLHLWSLSLEMQFYLLVPFIFFGLRVLKSIWLKLIAAILITVFGFIGYALVLESFAFNFMFLRLWQFSAGFVALFWCQIQREKLDSKSNTLPIISEEDLVVCSGVGLQLLTGRVQPTHRRPSANTPAPQTKEVQVPPICLRSRSTSSTLTSRIIPLVTFVTAVIISYEAKDVTIFKSKTLIYIGNISYALYLVHWPVISMFLAPTIKSYIFCIVIIFISSILLHHLFEKKYLKLGVKGIFGLILMLIASNAYLQYSIRFDKFWKGNIPAETQKIIDENVRLSQWMNEPPRDVCVEADKDTPHAHNNLNGFCKLPSGNGSISIMMIGNSYVLDVGQHIRAHFNYNYSDYRFISRYASYGLYADHTVTSQDALAMSKQAVELYKPDVLFIVARYMENIKKPIQPNDPVIQQINESIQFYEKIVKKLYILGAHPMYPANFLNLFLHYVVTRPNNLDVLHMDRKLADAEMKPVKQRFAQIKCAKCKFFDLSHVFIQGDKYLTFDKETLMSYADNSIHMAGPGIRLCEPVFEKIAKEIMNSF